MRGLYVGTTPSQARRIRNSRNPYVLNTFGVLVFLLIAAAIFFVALATLSIPRSRVPHVKAPVGYTYMVPQTL